MPAKPADALSFGYQNPLVELWDKTFFQSLPNSPGVYFFLDENSEPLYIGKAVNLRRRVMSYATAKPGQSYEHTLEMLDHVRSLKWELHPTGEAALAREADLLRVLRPPFNIAGTDPGAFLYCGLRGSRRGNRLRGSDASVDFRLSHHTEHDGFKMYGCFQHRGKTKTGYSALLRLLAASTEHGHRLNLPAQLCRTSPAYAYRMNLPTEWIRPLERFFAGEDADILKLIFSRLLDSDSLSRVLYAPVQRDFKAARTFFEIGPRTTRDLRRKAGLRSLIVSQSKMESWIRSRTLKGLPALAVTAR